MASVSSLSDSDLITRLPELVHAERGAMADVIEHLVEMERRRLYLHQATSSLYRYCIERLGYPEDGALKRHRVARLALRFPQVLDELRAGTIHLTGLFLLSTHLTDENAEALLAEARGKSRRQIEELIGRWFPRPDVAPSIEPVVTPTLSAQTEQPSLPGSYLGALLNATPKRATCPGGLTLRLSLKATFGALGRVPPVLRYYSERAALIVVSAEGLLTLPPSKA